MAQETPRYIILLLMLFGFTRVHLMRFKGKFKADFKEFIDIKIENNGRYRRSSGGQNPFPQNVDVRFTAFNDDVSLLLTRNDNVDQNVPIYVNRDGDIIRQHVPVLQNAAFYQNLEKGAAFMVEFNKTHIHDIFGSLHLHNEEYFVEKANHTEPTNQTRFQHQSTLYKLFKTKQTSLRYDYILKDGQTGIENMRRKFDHNFGRHARNKRAISVNQVELLIVTDYSVYQYWYEESTATTASEKDKEAKASVWQFYAFVINAIDVRYKSIVSSSVSISVVFAGIYISDDPSTSTWTEDKISIGTNIAVNIHTALRKFRTWERSTLGLPVHDHAMLFTKYDFTDSTDNGVAGLSYLEGICSSNRQSVVEDLFDFGMMTIAAHELGHNLGASHDGEGNTCSFEDGYIMAATTLIQTGDTASNPWQFSPCSITSFENKISTLNNDGFNCLSPLSTSFDPTGLTPYDQQIPGQLFDADTQCRRIVGDNSFLCRGFYYQDYSSICNRMYCSKADGTNFCSEHVPADGTSCGKNKWCMKGACVSNTSAPSVSDTCPFGDQAGIVSSGHTCASVVELNAYNCNSTGWYSYCCSTCGALYTGIPGCEYGDRSSQCKAEDCPIYSQTNLEICCGSCAVTTTTPTPTATTTTTPITSTTTLRTSPPTQTTTSTTPTPTTTTPTTTASSPTTTTKLPTTIMPTTTTNTPTTTTTTPTTTTTTTTPTIITPKTATPITTTPPTTTTMQTTSTPGTTSTAPVTITTSKITTPQTTSTIPTNKSAITTAPTTTTANTPSTSLPATADITTPTQIATTATQAKDSTTSVSNTTIPTSTSPLPTTSTIPQTTAATDELLKMLIIGVSVGVAGLLLIILISVGICLACRAFKRNKSSRGSSATPSVDVPNIYNGKVPSRSPAPTPVMFNNPYLSELSTSQSALSRNGRAHTPPMYQSHHLSPPQSQKWYPVYGGYTNHGLQGDNETNPSIQHQRFTDFDMRQSQHC